MVTYPLREKDSYQGQISIDILYIGCSGGFLCLYDCLRLISVNRLEVSKIQDHEPTTLANGWLHSVQAARIVLLVRADFHISDFEELPFFRHPSISVRG